MGLTMTSTMPPPMAQTTVAMANPAKGEGRDRGSSPRSSSPTVLNRWAVTPAAR